MKRRASLLLVVLLAPALTPPASAAPVDPLIGVRGTLSGSPPITDPTLQPFGSCDGLGIQGGTLPMGYSCAPYDTLGMNILSLTLQFFDANQNPFGVDALSLDFTNSFFGTMEFVDDFTVRLSNDVIEDFQVESIVTDPWPFTGLVIFTAAGPGMNDVPASFVSVLAVNDVPNVPEPAAMLLLGAGLVAAGVRRRRCARPPS